MAQQYRYSRPRFRQTIVTAAGLTVMVSGFAWLILSGTGVRQANWWTAATALVFFGFVSAGMLWRYLRDETVLAVLPTGLLDIRVAPEPVSWERIREVVIRQSETDFELDVHLWKRQGQDGAAGHEPDFTVELASLDASPSEVVEAIGRHTMIRSENGAGAISIS